MMGFSLKAMWNYKCPRCRHGKIFTDPFDISNPLDMPVACEYCGQKTEPEPGFYYGAMFMSYIISSWFLLLPTLLLVFYFNWSLNPAFAFTLALAAITYLKFLRGSRSLWFHMVVKHRPDIEAKVDKEMLEKNNRKEGPWEPRLSNK